MNRDAYHDALTRIEGKIRAARRHLSRAEPRPLKIGEQVASITQDCLEVYGWAQADYALGKADTADAAGEVGDE